MKSSNTFRDRFVPARCLRAWILSALVSICFVSAAGALDPAKSMTQYIHDRWAADRGFPGGAVYAICQSADGYLWIGTERGLVRFDGFNFTLIQRPIPDQPPIGAVRGLFADAEGNLWIRLEGPHLLRYRGGRFEDVFSRFDLQELAFTAMTGDNSGDLLLSGLGSQLLRYRKDGFEAIADANAVPGTVISLAETRDGRVWMGTRDGGLYRLNDGRVSAVSSDLADRKINALLPANDGGLWVGTDNGLLMLSRTEEIDRHLPASIDKLQILAMTRGLQGNVWVGSDHGLIRITAAGNLSLDLLDEKGGNPVTAVYEDRDGDLWFGGPQGLERLREGMFTTYSAGQGVSSDGNGPVYVDSSNRAWFAPYSGGLYWLKDGQVRPVTIAGLERDVVYSISGGDGEVWVGRQNGGLTVLTGSGDSLAARTYTEADGLTQNSVFSVHRSRDGTVWAGTVSAGVSSFKDGSFKNFSVGSGLPSNSVNSIVEGYDGTMWFGTPGGLTAFGNGQWKNRTAQDGLPSSNVGSIFEDSKHVLWIATSGGLAFLSSGHIGVPRNLPEPLREQIFGITEDGLGYLWFVTSDHVVQVNRERLLAGSLGDSDVQYYGTADGLEATEGVRRDQSLVADSDRRVWISLHGGIAVANPKLTISNSAPVNVRIESVSADGARINLQDSPKIAAGTRSITFNFAGTSLSAPGRVRYRYKLDGSDRNWSDAVELRQVIYDNLDPGSYRFRVVASNSAGLWNGPETSVPFVIERAFWQKWWFQASWLAACVLVIFLLYRLRMYRVTRRLDSRFQERLAERTRIAQELHDTLLQSFQGLMLRFQTVDNMLPGNPADAKQALEGALDRADEALSESRDAIQGIRSSTATSRDLVQSMNDLMAQLSEETSSVNGDKLTFSVLVEGEPRTVHPGLRDEIYPFAREALRNAFLHAQANRIETEIIFRASLLRVRFRDDGKGIDPKVLDRGGRAGHWGLVGMHERASRMRAQLSVWSKPGAGTEVELTIPGTIAYEKPPRRAGFRLLRGKDRARS